MERNNDAGHAPRGELPSMESLLAYRQHLDGNEFTQNVIRAAGRRRRIRIGILGAAPVASLAVAMAIRPDHFTFLQAFRLPLHMAGDIAATLPMVGLVAMSVVLILVIGTSKTIDSI
jgi:hypothetical protein